MQKRQALWFGLLAAIGIGGFFLMRTVYEPSEIEARAFLQKLLLAEAGVHARGEDGSVIRLESARIVRVDAAQCRPDDDSRYSVRHEPNAARRFVCRYTVVTPEETVFETVLRADRVPPGGPAETPLPGSLVDPSRYRVGSFMLRPIGLSEAEALLRSPAADD